MKFDFEHPPSPQEGMSPLDFAEFCETLLKNNPEILPGNCMQVHDDEKRIKSPFRLPESSPNDKVAEPPPDWPPPASGS